jgi:PAS domain S-box-containing protein
MMMEREAEEALKESERKYRDLFEQSALPMAKAVLDGRILLSNRKFQELTGYSEEELTGGMRVTNLMATEAIDDVLRYHEGRRKGEDVPSRYESAIMTKGGQRRDVVVTTGLISGSDEDITFMEDITERKHLEVQLQDSQKMDALGRLAAGIAHDFNNLVTAIIGYSDLLLSAMEEQDPMHKEIEVIKSAGERAALLTGHLQTFSRRQVTC